MQVKKYKIPSEKELKHINRKLKSCWGHSSHDEYFLQPYIELHAGPKYLPKRKNLLYCIINNFGFFYRGKKREKKSKHKSKRSSNEAQNMASLA